jgi:ribosomal protein S18 acetylase RimI-like enzyme
MTIRIRDATPADVSTIADYNSRLAEETEQTRLDPTRINPGVKALLADPSKGRYWLAVSGDQVVGQIAVTYEWSDWRNGMIWWIQSVYVHEDHRRRGVYSSLYQHIESLAQSDSKVIGIRLYVEKENKRAQQTYGKLGMNMTNYRVMQRLFAREK